MGNFLKKVFMRKNPELITSLTIQNMYIIRAIALVTAIIQLASLIWSYIYFDLMNSHPEVDIGPDQVAYVILLVFSVFTYLSIMKYKSNVKKHIHYVGNIIGIYLVMMLVFGIFISTRDMMYAGNSYVFITSLIVVFGLVIMNPTLSVIISMSSYLIFLLCLGYIGKMYVFDCMNMLYLIIYLNIISAIRYYALCKLLVMQSELDKTNKILENISFFDELSHTKNRNALRQDWKEFYGKTLCVSMIDIDGFKKFNDDFGHTIGDNVIESIAHALVESFGKDTVYRVGGDEFLIVIGISEEDFKIRLINAKLSINNIKINNMRLNATISAGCCRGICHNDQDMRRMMNKADELLYIVKKSGKNGLKTQTEENIDA